MKTARRPKSSSDEPRSIGKLVLRLCAVALAVAMMVLGAVYLHYRSYVRAPVLDEGDEITVVIPKNTAWPQVVSILERAGLVERSTYFEYWARRRHLPPAVKAGTYELSGPMDLGALSDKLREGGKVDETVVTFPEGLTIFHMADKVERMGLASREEFLRAARDEAALDEAGIEADTFEGYLFPDTYRFRKGTSAAEIIERMHARWRAVWTALTQEHAENKKRLAEKYDFDQHDFVTLASLVQRETSVPAESDMIARVFLNRLDRDMRLQTDPTCVYGEETYDKIPHPKYCKDKLNRYSTYVIDGLPPGPIANPGRVSLQAALDPSQESDAKAYLFFVARRDGTMRHYFSKTFAEHKKAIRRFLK